jgi:hypothetical protein
MICSGVWQVCLDLLDSPASTACGHTFCLECINSIAQQDANTQQGPCPNCRAPVKATELYQLTTVDSSAAAGNAAGDTAATDHALSPLLAASQLTGERSWCVLLWRDHDTTCCPCSRIQDKSFTCKSARHGSCRPAGQGCRFLAILKNPFGNSQGTTGGRPGTLSILNCMHAEPFHLVNLL